MPGPAETPRELDRGGLPRLLDDALGVWTEQIALDRAAGPVLTGFEETVVERSRAEVLETPAMPGGSARGFAFPDDDRATEVPRVDTFTAAIKPRMRTSAIRSVRAMISRSPSAKRVPRRRPRAAGSTPSTR